MEILTKIVLPIALVVIAAVVGFCTSVLTSARVQRQTVTMKLLDQYFEVHKDVVDTVSQLTSVDVREPLSGERQTEFRDRAANLYYKHYDLLPKPVLDALILLHVALDYPEKGPYMIQDRTILPMAESQIPEFIESCSLYKNATFSAPLALKSRNVTVRNNQVIRMHARRVLATLNQFSSIEDLLKLAKKSKKGM